MKSIVFAAELGSGFGHVRRLLPLAFAAAERGYAPIFVVSNPDEVAPLLRKGARFELRRAPTAPRQTAPLARNVVARSFADILGAAGFGDANRLAGLTAGWEELLAMIEPAAIVSEHSPFLCAAAFCSGRRLLSLGHGFILPPPELARFPPLLEGAPAYDEAQLLETLANLCKRHGCSPPATLPALLAGSAHAITGFDVLDPYREHRRQRAQGLLELELRAPASTPSEDLFAYLLGDAPCTLPLLSGAAGSGLRGRVFVRRGTEAQREAVAGSHLLWLREPEPVASALERASIVLHHGSMLMSEEALAAGRAQVLAPLYLEHLLTARSLVGLGVASVIRQQHSAAGVADLLLRMQSSETVLRKARAFAVEYWQSGGPPPDFPARLLASAVNGVEGA